MSEFNRLQQVKRHFFAMRNGIIADALRRGGSPFKIIFGLNLPQIAEMALEYGPDIELAHRLWENRSTRESMLLAPMLIDPETFSPEEANKWLSEIPTPEVADNLCHKLLRRLPYAYDIAIKSMQSNDDMQHYAALRIFWHFLSKHPQEIRHIAESELNRKCKLTFQSAFQIIEELDFIENTV